MGCVYNACQNNDEKDRVLAARMRPVFYNILIYKVNKINAGSGTLLATISKYNLTRQEINRLSSI